MVQKSEGRETGKMENRGGLVVGGEEGELVREN